MLIDTHCHLDAAEFNVDRDYIALMAKQQGVDCIVVPAVERANFDTVIALCNRHQNCAYALGIHPMYVDAADNHDIKTLQTYIENHHPIALGEIGLDYFVRTPKLNPDHIEKQVIFFTEQLKLAAHYDLPVLLHVRQAVDDVLKYLRRHPVRGGIAHAFNGSLQQAEQFIELGFKLGFGGAMTYSRALKIRDLAVKLPLDAIVLETDAPDMSPAWIGPGVRNSPLELLKIAQVLADLRQINVAQVHAVTGCNALHALPKLAELYTSPQVLH
jgi:TatD DNase family protein